MTRSLVWFCVFLVLGAGAYQLMDTRGSGYLLMVWGQTSIEMSLWFAIYSLLAIFLLIRLLFIVFRGGFQNIKYAREKLFSSSDRKAQQKTLEGLIDYIEEDWASARKKLTRASSKVETPLINYLASARSAYEMGDEQAALELLHKAERCTDKSSLAVPIIQARMQLGNAQYEQALATLERAAAINAEHPVVLSLRRQVCVALKDWKSLKALLPKLVQNHIGTADEHHQLELSLYRERFQEIQDKNYTLTPSEEKTCLQQLWRELPEALHQEQWFLAHYASRLMALQEHDLAEKILAQGLRGQWHVSWLDLYGLLACADKIKPLKTAEKWLTEHRDSPQLLLALGRLCMRDKQWGRAVSFLQQSLKLQQRLETSAELARTLEIMGKQQQSNRCYKEGLLTNSSGLVRL
ncbi:MAG: HemY protein [Cellvibrionaceae bacterium]|jgi:HemY protein